MTLNTLTCFTGSLSRVQNLSWDLRNSPSALGVQLAAHPLANPKYAAVDGKCSASITLAVAFRDQHRLIIKHDAMKCSIIR